MVDNAVHKNMKPTQIRHVAISTATLAITIAILVIFITCESPQTDPTPVPPPSPIVISEPAQTQLQKCTLFFFDTNSLRLAGEERQLNLSQDVTERLKQTITALLSDSISGLYQTIPKGTLLYEVYVDEQATAYLDFSQHLKDGHIGGTTSEALTVAAILRTVKVNFSDAIRKVQILIEGLETDTIGGHVDISKPLRLTLDLEVVSKHAESTEAESTEVESTAVEPAEAETVEAGQASGQETDN
ncbi:GerMN domain-containing protein [Candidatus Poribacteria bacterium]|nr:GerMN domain-containing protein [Candidatus Poribacteria bacterium]